jgi:act minimal PKS acyl carrier protein
MQHFNLDDLRAIISRSAGETEAFNRDAGFAERTYADLGYDSLALLEIAAQIEREHGVTVPEDMMLGASTPQATASLVDDLLTGPAKVLS